MTKKQFNIEWLSLLTFVMLIAAVVCACITVYNYSFLNMFIWELGVMGLILGVVGFALWRFIVFYVKFDRHD